MIFFMAIDPKDFKNEAVVSQVESHVQTTRSDVARLHRATQDIERHISRTRQNIDATLRDSRYISSEALKNLAEERNRLNALDDDADRLKNSLMKNSPAASTAAFSDKEKKEIKALYDSGLYTQKELAQQYGVSQSAISQTTKRSSD